MNLRATAKVAFHGDHKENLTKYCKRNFLALKTTFFATM
jgi:hypothetical protein